MSEYRDELISQIKAIGKDLTEHAAEFVPERPYLSSYSIWLKFPQGFDVFPTIEVSAEYLSEELLKIMKEGK